MSKDFEELKKIIREQVKEGLKPLQEKQNNWAEIFNTKKEDTKVDKSLVAARLIRALVGGQGDPEKAASFVKKNWGDDPLNDEVLKALSTETGPTGGYIVPPHYSDELIELLGARAVVRKMGAVSLPLVGSLSLPKLVAGATAYFVGENMDAIPSEPSFDQVILTEKTLVALVPIPNKLIRLSSPKADVVVRNDIIAAMARREDLAFIRGDGTQYTPKGLLYWALPDNKFAANSTVNVANVAADLQKAILKLEEADIPFTRPGWLMAPRTKQFLMNAMNSNGQYVWKDEMEKGTLLGIPYAVTTQIPTNLGDSGKESEIYLVDFNECIIGDGITLEVQVSTEATYLQGNSLVSAFSRDQTVIKITSTVDFAVRHEKAIAVITGVLWGAPA